MKSDISKENLYLGVKQLIEEKNSQLQLSQHKFFTLVSISFQYFLYRSFQDPGVYIIRIENPNLAAKLSKKSKDESTRKFLMQLQTSRKLKYKKSQFLLDFFQFNTWSLTSDIPTHKIKGALIIKNPTNKLVNDHTMEELVIEEDAVENPFPEDYYLTSLVECSPTSIYISNDKTHDLFDDIRFPFIKKEKEVYQGMKISKDINIDDIIE